MDNNKQDLKLTYTEFALKILPQVLGLFFTLLGLQFFHFTKNHGILFILINTMKTLLIANSYFLFMIFIKKNQDIIFSIKYQQSIIADFILGVILAFIVVLSEKV